MSSHVPEQPRGQKLWQEPNIRERGRPWGLRQALVMLTRGVTAPWQPLVPLPSSQQGLNLSLASRHYKHSKDTHFLRAAFSCLQIPALGTPCPHNPYKPKGVPFPVQPSVTSFQTPTNAPGTSPTAEPHSPSPLPQFAIGSRNAFSSFSSSQASAGAWEGSSADTCSLPASDRNRILHQIPLLLLSGDGELARG